MALCQNANLTELKLAYNNLGDVGVTILAGGIATHATLTLLDLGFNNVGDDGICALMNGLHQRHQKQQQQQQKYRGTLQTLYLAGNLVGEDGAIAIADCIRHGNTRLQKLYMTGNRIGGEGVKAITEAILEEGNHIIMKKNGTTVALAGVDGLMGSDATLRLESHINQPTRTHHRLDLEDNATETAVQSIKSLAVSSSAWKQNQQQQYPQQVLTKCTNFCGMQELFLGGTGLGSTGCRAVARLLAKSHTLRVLSLPNCDMGDDEVAVLAASIKENKDHLPIESLQLSFNRITHRGMEMLTNALWRSVTLKELEVDNNDIGDRGAHHIATILPGIKNLETLDVGFNSIKVAGLNILMKTVAESQHLQSLSVSGNTIDVHAAKAVAFALAYNCSLTSIHLVHCSIVQEGQRHISAGIVSNSRTALRKLTGF
jgi:Ran GTPase-activating protein (RanGAP) involved in mRNA processing and transport